MSLADLSDDSLDAAANPTFDQLNFLLISRGYTSKPLIIPTGTSDETVQALSNTIHSLLSQREQDVEMREQLAAKNRTLQATVERLKRAVDEEMRKSEDLERKMEAAKVKADTAQAAQNQAIAAHKNTQADLLRARAELQGIKVAAHQYRLSVARGSERLKSKLAETSLTALRSVIPSLRVATGAFSDYKGIRGALMQAQGAATSSLGASVEGPEGSTGIVLKEQLKELEEERAGLLQATEVLKRMTTEAVNALRAVDRRLCGFEAEEASSASTGSSELTSSSAKSLKRKAHDAFGNDSSEGLVPIPHEELFPRAHPLRAAPALSYTSIDPNKPATRSNSAGTSSTRSSAGHNGSGPAHRVPGDAAGSNTGPGTSANAHPAAIALQESVSSLYRRLDAMDSRQAAAAAAARAAARAAKRARTFKSPAPISRAGPTLATAAAISNDAALLAKRGSPGSAATTVTTTADRALTPRTNLPASVGTRSASTAKRVPSTAMRQSRGGRAGVSS